MVQHIKLTQGVYYSHMPVKLDPGPMGHGQVLLSALEPIEASAPAPDSHLLTQLPLTSWTMYPPHLGFSTNTSSGSMYGASFFLVSITWSLGGITRSEPGAAGRGSSAQANDRAPAHSVFPPSCKLVAERPTTASDRETQTTETLGAAGRCTQALPPDTYALSVLRMPGT